MNTRARLEHLDVIKGIAIILVILGHMAHWGVDMNGDVSDSFLIVKLLKSIHMPLFMLVAGYLSLGSTGFCGSWVNFWSYLSKRAQRLLLPLIAIPTLSILIYSKHWQDVLGSTMKGGYWFTWTLFQICIVFYLYRWSGSLLRVRLSSKWLDLLWGMLWLMGIKLLDTQLRLYTPELYKWLSFEQLSLYTKFFFLGYWMRYYSSWEEWLLSDGVIALATLVYVATGVALYVYALPMQSLLLFLQTLSGLISMYGLCYSFVNKCVNGGGIVQNLYKYYLI